MEAVIEALEVREPESDKLFVALELRDLDDVSDADELREGLTESDGVLLAEGVLEGT